MNYDRKFTSFGNNFNLSSYFAKLSTVLVCSSRWLAEISRVSLRLMLIKSEFTPKLLIIDAGSWYQISLSKLIWVLNVYLFLVKTFNTGTKDLVSLYIGACKTDKIGQNWVAAIYLLFICFAASILSTCTSSNCFYWLTYFFYC